jgi:hypothetical protein
MIGADNEMDLTSLPVLVLFGMRPRPIVSNRMTYDSEDIAEVPKMRWKALVKHSAELIMT